MDDKTITQIKHIGGYAFSLFLFVALFEISVGFFLDHADLLRFKPDNLLRKYYMRRDRNIIQYQPECARYDKDLSYTLKPGTCRFNNREFATTYHINSLGMRDDETSLSAPEVIVVGDSFAMGWGVEQNETFAQIIEQQTHLSVLNTAISSYGTARELKALSRVSLNKTKYLIIQYCRNDYQENLTFLKNNNALPIMDEAEYNKEVKKLARKNKYYFGKQTLYFTKSLFNRLADIIKPPATAKLTGQPSSEEAEVFLNALLHTPVNLNDLTIIVIDLNPQGYNDGLFINSLKLSLSKNNTPLFKNVITLDISQKLTSQDFFVLDDHINAHGHQVIADEISGLLQLKRQK